MVAAGVEKEPAALYVHWPWCVRKCPYCDFNSFACAGKIPEGAYIDALLKDLTHAVKDLAGRPVATVFSGRHAKPDVGRGLYASHGWNQKPRHAPARCGSDA